MIQIDDLKAWLDDYFSDNENQQKSEKACERYDRLMVKNIRRQLFAGTEQIDLSAIEESDPGKRLEKVKYETLSSVEYLGEKGSLRINLLNKTAEFIADK